MEGRGNLLSSLITGNPIPVPFPTPGTVWLRRVTEGSEQEQNRCAASVCTRKAQHTNKGRFDPKLLNVTEDADLGYRLARAGWGLDTIAPPTWEEAPARFGPWLRQRTRWIKGHFQTWLVLMRNPVRTAGDLGLCGFLWMQLVLGGGLVAACAHAPLLALLVAAALAPGLVTPPPLDWVLVIFGYATASLGALFAAAIGRDRRLALSALTMPLYWPLASLAALAALVEIVVRPHYWAKTDHGRTPRHTPD